MPQTDLTQLLTTAPIPEPAKAELWDVFQRTRTPDDLATQLQALPVPQELKAQLWDLKAATATTATSPRMNFAMVNGQRVPMDTWAEQLHVDRTSLAPAVDFLEGAAAMPGQAVFGGGDVIRRALNMPRVIGNPDVQRAMAVPDSDAGAAGNTVAQVAPLAYGLWQAPLATLSGIGASLLAKPTQPVIEAGAQMAGANPQQAQAIGEAGEFTIGSLLGIGGAHLGQKQIPRVAGWFRNPDMADAAAVDAALGQGLPVDVPTATGNRALRGVQWLADRTIGGSVAATRADKGTVGRWRQRWNQVSDQTGVTQPRSFYDAGTEAQTALQANQEQLQRSVRRDADRLVAGRGGAVPRSAEGAGRDVKQRLGDVVTRLRERASSGYRAAWEAATRRPVLVPMPERMPDGTMVERDVEMAAPVDMRGIKALGRRQLEIMNQWIQPALRNASAGYQALKSIVEGPDYVPAEIAEMGRSGLLELSREAEMPAARNVSQATGARLASVLTEAIDAAMEQHAGPEALAALRAGRATHAEKMGVVETLRTLSDEPVQAFGSLTWTGDRGIERLLAIDKAAPEALPEIGRAWFRGLLEKFETDTGGLDLSKAQAIARAWDELGPRTQALFFKRTAQRQAVDAFMRDLGTARAALGPTLGTEPQLVAEQLIGRNDHHVRALQAVANIAPRVPKMLGRAALDEVAAKFDQNPSIENLSKFRTWWNQLGPRTRAILFQDPQLVQQIDQATRVMQLISENPNRSGTAFLSALGAQGAQLYADPVTGVAAQGGGFLISRALRSPKAARFLTQGLSTPNTATPAIAQRAGALIQLLLAEQQGVPPQEDK